MDEATERFGGLWRLSRDIEDRHSGQSGRFRGIVRIRPDEEGLRYEETGTLELGASRTPAQRVYLWRAAGPTTIRVLFEDGGFFHVFDWSRATFETTHECGEDHYAVRYSFAASSWHAHWTVTGPRKDYSMSGRYLRGV